jgi:hypothetical protein
MQMAILPDVGSDNLSMLRIGMNEDVLDKIVPELVASNCEKLASSRTSYDK